MKPVNELEEMVTELEVRVNEQNLVIQAFQAKVAKAESILKLALDSYYESDWTDLAYDVLGQKRRKSVAEIEIENVALKAEVTRLKGLDGLPDLAYVLTDDECTL